MTKPLSPEIREKYIKYFTKGEKRPLWRSLLKPSPVWERGIWQEKDWDKLIGEYDKALEYLGADADIILPKPDIRIHMRNGIYESSGADFFTGLNYKTELRNMGYSLADYADYKQKQVDYEAGKPVAKIDFLGGRIIERKDPETGAVTTRKFNSDGSVKSEITIEIVTEEEQAKAEKAKLKEFERDNMPEVRAEEQKSARRALHDKMRNNGKKPENKAVKPKM